MWQLGDIPNIIWLTPEEFYDVVEGICEPGQTEFPVNKYVFYQTGTNSLYYEVFSLPNDQIIDINDFDSNPWNSRKEVKVGLLQEYLNYYYPIPYDSANNEYFWLPG